MSCSLLVEAVQLFKGFGYTVSILHCASLFRKQDRKQSPSFNALKPSTGSQRYRGGRTGSLIHREARTWHRSGDHFSCNDGENTIEQLMCSCHINFCCKVNSKTQFFQSFIRPTVTLKLYGQISDRKQVKFVSAKILYKTIQVLTMNTPGCFQM